MRRSPAPSDPFLSLRLEGEIPKYRQLYEALRSAILAGVLPAGGRIPSSRIFSDLLGCSRTTVVAAVGQLLADGLLEARVGAGTFVAGTRVPSAPPSSLLASGESLSKRGQYLASIGALRHGTPGSPRAFRPGLPALAEFPWPTWTRLAAKAWRSLAPEAMDYPDPAGYRPLREAIAQHLSISRGVQVRWEQVMIVSGSQQALELTARLVLDPGDVAWVEDPGYAGARQALRASGARPVPVPLDPEGLDLRHAFANLAPARLIHVTPSHQYPLGVRMSLERRVALIEWAQQHEAWIVEDDYDGEYRYRGRPLAPLLSLDRTGRVLYVGSFSKVLFPALRLGYLVVPPGLTGAFRTVRAFLDRGSSTLLQAVVAEFIQGGHYLTHLHRMRTLYAQRRDTLRDLLRSELGGLVDAEPTDAGLHMIAWLPAGTSDTEISRLALQEGIEARALSSYAALPLARPGLVLGFAGLTQSEMKMGVQALARVLTAPGRRPRP